MFFGLGARKLIFLAVIVSACRMPENPAPLPPTTTETSSPVAVCPLISTEAASAAMGEPMSIQLGPPSGACTLVPAIGSQGSIVVQTVADTANFYQLTTQPDAVMFDLGDRAVWMTTSRELHVVDGKRTIVVKMSNQPMKISEMTGKAQAIARAILAHR